MKTAAHLPIDRASQVLEVWGDYACFTRPELKVERFSYPVITPSAARGIFDSIYLKPSSFRWSIQGVEVLSPLQFIPLRRNEVKSKLPSARTIKKWMYGKGAVSPLVADEDRTQRQTIALRNVKYRIHGKIVPWNGKEANTKGMESQFRRRAARGQCIFQPYLGCREFPAYFRLIENGQEEDAPVALNMEIGCMVYDVFDLSKRGTSLDKPSVSLFEATIRDGTLLIPDYHSEAVLKGPGAS
nr:type I-C CRISPR-associated protein Cas5 [Euryarchaeota archaeon]